MTMRLEYVTAAFNAEEGETISIEPPDAIALVAAAVAERFGHWYDPVLSPEQCIEYVEFIVGEYLSAVL